MTREVAALLSLQLTGGAMALERFVHQMPAPALRAMCMAEAGRLLEEAQAAMAAASGDPNCKDLPTALREAARAIEEQKESAT